MITALDALPKIAAPAVRALNMAGYISLRALAGASRPELATLHGVGPEVLRILEQALEEHGLVLKQEGLPDSAAAVPSMKAAPQSKSWSSLGIGRGEDGRPISPRASKPHATAAPRSCGNRTGLPGT